MEYEAAIAGFSEVKSVKWIRRSAGANVFLDVVVTMDKSLTVEKSHNVADAIEDLLADRFQVFDTDIHIEPATE